MRSRSVIENDLRLVVCCRQVAVRQKCFEAASEEVVDEARNNKHKRRLLT
jgi:hypothetical protein